MLDDRRHLVEIAITLQQLGEIPRSVGGPGGTQRLAVERLGESLEARQPTRWKRQVVLCEAPLHQSEARPGFVGVLNPKREVFVLGHVGIYFSGRAVVDQSFGPRAVVSGALARPHLLLA